LPENLYIPLLDLGKITGYRWASAILYLLLVLGLYAVYAAGYAAVRDRRSGIRLWHVFLAGAIFSIELVWAYPATAVDVFAYIADGRIFALYHSNPFVVAPNAFPNDPILPYLAFPDEPSQYGPVWVLLGGAVSALARGDLLTEVLAYKVVASLAHVAGGAFVFLIARRLTSNPTTAIASAYLYLWNPLLLWEMVGNAHNDGAMMLFGLIAVWLFVANIDVLVMAAVALGALVKLPLTLIGPMLFVGVWHRARARAIEGALLALALAVVVYRPFWEGTDTLTALHRTDLFTASIGEVVRLALAPTTGIDLAATIARTASLSAFVVVVVVAFIFTLRAHTDAEVLRPAYFTLLGAVLLATTWFQAWYIAWPLALGASLAESRRHMEVALLSLGGLLQYFVFIYLWVLGVFPPYENLGVQSAAYLAILGPFAIGVIASNFRPHRTRLALPKRVSAGEYD
jgi:alpha-1,6-mannosyltransferase